MDSHISSVIALGHNMYVYRSFKNPYKKTKNMNSLYVHPRPRTRRRDRGLIYHVPDATSQSPSP